ncbi:MAG TPA: hypothetical protein VMH04_15870 [Candidatus Solibacter sp.]|nr:hypothetical protein [Candidatus Solibacter sp.]
MVQTRKFCVTFVLAALLPVLMPAIALAQDDPNDTPLGDVARNLRKKAPSKAVIDDDNLSDVMRQAESRQAQSSALKFLMTGDNNNFKVGVPDATCSLSFSAGAKSLLSSQYSQMDLPLADMQRLAGPASVEGDTLSVSVLNGTDWHVSEIAVAFTVVKRNAPAGVSLNYAGGKVVAAAILPEAEVRPEKRPDTTVIYRMRAAAPPSATTVFSAPLELDLAAGDEWHWAIVQAKGYPPQGYNASALPSSQAMAREPAQPAIPSSLTAPSDLAASPLPPK